MEKFFSLRRKKKKKEKSKHSIGIVCPKYFSPLQRKIRCPERSETGSLVSAQDLTARLQREVRISFPVISWSIGLGTLANVFWNTRGAYLRWHRAARCPSFISPRRNKVVSRSNIANPFPFRARSRDFSPPTEEQIKDSVHASRVRTALSIIRDAGQRDL